MTISNKKCVWMSVVGLLAGLISVSGCVAGDGGTGDSLRVVEMDEAAGRLVLEYRRDGRRIQYDMRLGAALQAPPSEHDLAANPELPTHEVDLHVLDGRRVPLVVRMGRHGDLEPLRAPAAGDAVDRADRQPDLALLAGAVAELRALDVPPGLEPIRLAAIQAGLPPADTSYDN